MSGLEKMELRCRFVFIATKTTPKKQILSLLASLHRKATQIVENLTLFQLLQSFGSQVWDCGLSLQALLASDLIDDIGPVLKKGHEFLKESQVCVLFLQASWGVHSSSLVPHKFNWNCSSVIRKDWPKPLWRLQENVPSHFQRSMGFLGQRSWMASFGLHSRKFEGEHFFSVFTLNTELHPIGYS